ncbi:MAG: hypothetical protein KDA17_07175 [Candidatus Saccharibacteria bacterium]|nr:hypothetical protein [Candidatus Saccharibacteria bacterium]
MDGLILVLVLILNVAISIWNCYAAGTAWKDTMAFGSTFDKVLLWSAAIQSGVGFSMPILLVLAYGSTYFLTGGAEPTMSPAEAQEFMQAIFSLWYVAVIFPILGSGLAIWIHSIRAAFQRRDFASIATAGWNTFAQVHNTISAVENLGGALGNVGDFFGKALNSKGGDGKGKAGILLILIVVLALVAGFMITFALIRYFARTSESRLEQFAEQGMRA